MNTIPTLDTFIDSLVQTLRGEANLSPEAIEEMKAGILPRLHKFIVLKTMTRLAENSQADLIEYQKLVEQNVDIEQIQNFVADKIPDYTAFLADVLLQFRELYLKSNQDNTKV